MLKCNSQALSASDGIKANDDYLRIFVRTIEFEKIAKAVESLCIEAAYELPDDVLGAIKLAQQKETNASAAKILQALIDNASIASEERIPLCQDTGVTVVFIEQGGSGGYVAAPVAAKILRSALTGKPVSELKRKPRKKTITPEIENLENLEGDPGSGSGEPVAEENKSADKRNIKKKKR